MGVASASKQKGPRFDENYRVSWGQDHVKSSIQGREVQISLDKDTGSGIQSKSSYGSGFFHMRIKLPGNDSAGVVTTFYVRQDVSQDISEPLHSIFNTLTSHTGNHNELDFEFLGNRQGKPYLVQTNVFVNGKGDREQRVRLWFDPTAAFHGYSILWNQHQVVFFVDKVPIRVFENNTKTGLDYLTQPMQVEATIWDGDTWATDDGQTKINWTHAPFTAHFRSFAVDGCSSNSGDESCSSSKFWWNKEQYWRLTHHEETVYHHMKRKYMNYNYCTDKSRHLTPPPDSLLGQLSNKVPLIDSTTVGIHGFLVFYNSLSTFSGMREADCGPVASSKVFLNARGGALATLVKDQDRNLILHGERGMCLASLWHYLSFVLVEALAISKQNGPSYDENYKVAFGVHNIWPQHQGRDVQLSLDQSSGSGIESKLSYLSGFFHLRIKLPGKDSAGVVTAFYMTSPTIKGNELDFEFLGNREGKPYTLQSNVIINGKAGREQRMHLWFDPTSSFHTYRLLWNSHQIV
ncbi:unnamed protein product [Ilex paraguariensis]|uniref:xyloglucan:xyloglucosyl transferase n=1 Tax=Ilex paraguariensis TaxID=185542 RepID=A0ABC8QYX2_9AQUA